MKCQISNEDGNALILLKIGIMQVSNKGENCHIITGDCIPTGNVGNVMSESGMA